jgi:hypothetical protein
MPFRRYTTRTLADHAPQYARCAVEQEFDVLKRFVAEHPDMAGGPCVPQKLALTGSASSLPLGGVLLHALHDAFPCR